LGIIISFSNNGMKISLPFSRLFLFSLLIPMFLGCDKFESDQTIPAYIHIDSIFLTTDHSTQGTASYNITDAWVYVDGTFIGAFELPATFPVLKEGTHELSIYAGVKKNGIGATRTAYPFFKPFTKDVVLIPDSILSFSPSVRYYDNTEFTWIEDFEDIAVSIDSTRNSKVSVKLTPPGPVFEGLHSGMITLTDSLNFFEIANKDGLILTRNKPVFLELNFNTEQAFTIGIFAQSLSSVQQHPVMVVNKTNGVWKKIYVDLSLAVASFPTALEYKVFFGGFKDDGTSEAKIYFDNIKLVTR